MSQARSRTLKALRLAALAAIGATALAVTPAWANPIPINSWTFTANSSFDTGATTFSSGCGKSNPASNSVSSDKIIWGCKNGSKRSSLKINPSVGSGTVFTDGSQVDLGVTLTHNNFVIHGSHLKTTILQNSITLTPAGGGTEESFDLNFGINFTETDNKYPCAATPDPKNNPCPDIFVLDNSSLNHYFEVGGFGYYASILPASGIGGLNSKECEAAGVTADSCTGFVTQENAKNQLEFLLAITSKPLGGGPGEPVPEPGALGMMGFGLFSILALLFLRRRRTAEDKVD